MTNHNNKLAVLIDADNAPADIIEAMLEEIATYGTATVKRIYGDWSHGLAKWKAALLPHALIPVQQFAYTKGKNATDMALVIDAMDLLYSNNFDGFCLVSSDSDFTRLASRIRENGLTVYGFGEKKTPESFRKACDKFTYIEIFRPQRNTTTSKNKAKTTNEHNSNNIDSLDLTQLIKRAVKENADDFGWANLGPVGSYISKISPDFDSRLYGFAKLSDLVKSLDDFEHRSEHNKLQIRTIQTDTEIKTQKNMPTSKNQTKTANENNSNNIDSLNLTQLIKHAVKENADDFGWANLGPIGSYISKINPDFDSRLYGFAKLSDLIKSLNDFEHRSKHNKLQIRTIQTDTEIKTQKNQQSIKTNNSPKRQQQSSSRNTPSPKQSNNTPITVIVNSETPINEPITTEKAKVPYSKIIPMIQQAINQIADEKGWASLSNTAKQLENQIDIKQYGYQDSRELIRSIYSEWLEIKKAGRGERVRNQKIFTPK